MSDADDFNRVDDGDDEVDDHNRIDAPEGGDTAVGVLEYLVRELVDEPDAVEVDPVSGRRGTTLEVRVAPGDMGRVIGRRGRMATAIRTVVRAAAVRDGTDVEVEFED